MSIEFFEGFETVGTETGLANQASTRPRIDLRFDNTASGGIPATDSFFLRDDDFSEGYAIQMGQAGFSNQNRLDWYVPAAKQEAPGASFREWVIGIRFHTPSTARTWSVMSIRGFFGGSSDTGVIGVEVENCANINISRADPGAFEIANADGVLTTNQWYYLEVKFKIAESVDGGFVEVRLDGNEIIAQTTADTNNDLSTGFKEVRFQNTNNSTGDDYIAYDDIYIMDTSESPHTDFLGPVRVRSLPPNTDIEPGWQNSAAAGDNYTKIDENGADTADYVWTDVDNTRDRYGVTNPSEPDAIIATKMEVEATNPFGADPSMFVEVNSGTATDSVEFAVTNTTAYELFTTYQQEDPAGGDWTVSAVDDVRIGYLFRNNLQE